MGVNGMLTAGEVLLQWRPPRGFNFWLMDYPLIGFYLTFAFITISVYGVV